MADSVIVTVAPSVGAGHYREFFADLVGFLTRLIEASHPDDQFLVVVDPQTVSKIRDRVPQKNLLVGSIPDIWIRLAFSGFKNFEPEPCRCVHRHRQGVPFICFTS